MTQNAQPMFLILSAWEPEQRLLRELFGWQESSVSQPLADLERAYAADLRERYGASALFRMAKMVRFLCLGVGVFKALESLSCALSDHSGADAQQLILCFTGTAGIVGRKFTAPFAGSVHTVCWYDPFYYSGQSYVPPQMEQELVYRSEPSACRLGVMPAVGQAQKCLKGCLRKEVSSERSGFCCLSTFGITRDTGAQSSAVEAVMMRIGSPSDEVFVENLELYAVARSALRLGLQWNACLGISNETGQEAHEQWRTHHTLASCLAQELLLASLLCKVEG